MAARRKKHAEDETTEATSSAGLMRWVVATILLATVFVGVYFGWARRVRPIVAESYYRLSADNIEIPTPPPWIKADVKAEVLRDASLSTASMLENDVAVRVADAFELNPWVAKVRRVSKRSPTRIEVDLEYRRPVAWVKVPAGMFPEIGEGVLPIDRDAVLLPQSDFSTADLGKFMRIDIADVSMCGPVGTPWGDPRVAGAAKIAELLADDWQQLGVWLIRAVTDYGRGGPKPRIRFELQTRQGKRIIWGSAPGEETAGEPPAAQKLHLLASYVRDHGPLDNTELLGLDLRDAVRTAELPRP